jgi:hypothetical protein
MWNFEDWIEKQQRSRRMIYLWSVLGLTVIGVIYKLIQLWRIAPAAWRTIFGPHT